MSTTSQSLLGQIQGGPEGLAWQRWHALYEPLIHGWLARHRLIAADRDDVSQNVLAVVVRRIGEFHHNGRVGAFRTWLKSITINCLRDTWKAQRNHPRTTAALGALDDWADDKSLLSREWDQEHDRHIVQKLLTFLQPAFSAETWSAFERIVVEGRTASEVGAELGMSVNAVYIAKSRVLTRLRQEAAGLVDDPKQC